MVSATVTCQLGSVKYVKHFLYNSHNPVTIFEIVKIISRMQQ
jgi:hypothetical protein